MGEFWRLSLTFPCLPFFQPKLIGVLAVFVNIVFVCLGSLAFASSCSNSANISLLAFFPAQAHRSFGGFREHYLCLSGLSCVSIFLLKLIGVLAAFANTSLLAFFSSPNS